MKVYTLTKEYAGTILEVRGDQRVVVLSLRDGPLTMRGLTPDELRACGALLYRPCSVLITLTEDAAPNGHEKEG